MVKCRRAGVPAVAAAVILMALTGCTGAPADKPDASSDGSLSLSPAADIAYRCLVEAGWPVTLSWDGAVGADSNQIPTSQLEVFNEASEECWAPVNDRIASLSLDDKATVYTQEVETRECLIELGYDVSAAPSEQAFIDSFDGQRWSAYGASGVTPYSLEESEWRRINENCPQPAWALGSW